MTNNDSWSSWVVTPDVQPISGTVSIDNSAAVANYWNYMTNPAEGQIHINPVEPQMADNDQHERPKFKTGDRVIVLEKDRDFSPAAKPGLIGVIVERKADFSRRKIGYYYGIFFEKDDSEVSKNFHASYRSGHHYVFEDYLDFYNPIPEGDDWI
jgi:hypothetical protein